MWCEVILNWKLDLEKNIDKIFEIHVKRNTFSQGGVLEKDRGSTSTVPYPKGLYHEETSALTQIISGERRYTSFGGFTHVFDVVLNPTLLHFAH